MTMYANHGNPVRAQYYTGSEPLPADDAPAPAEKPQEQRENPPAPIPSPEANAPQLQVVPGGNVSQFPIRSSGSGMKWLMWATGIGGIILVFLLLMSVPTEDEDMSERRERRHAPSRRFNDWLDDDDDGFNPFREGRWSDERRGSSGRDGERRGERATSERSERSERFGSAMSGIVPPIIINNPGMPPTVVPGSRAGD